MNDESSNLAYRQLERDVSEGIQIFYLAQLGHQPYKVSCQLSDKMLSIIIEDPITQPERLLAQSGNQELAQQVRFNIDKAFQPQLKALIEEIVGVSVTDLLEDSRIQSGNTTILAVLAATPPLLNQPIMPDSDND